MNRPADLVKQAKAMGATFELTTNGVKVSRREGPLPSDLLEELRRHKDDIRVELVKHRYTLANLHPGQQEEELRELVRRVEEEGYVFAWSVVLKDLVAFHRNDVDPSTIPTGFVPYSEHELTQLYPEHGKPISENTLRLIHKAKPMGLRVSERKEE